LLLDSPQLGRRLPWSRRLRYRFKPLVVPDAEMLGWFDACIGLSTDVESHFAPSGKPFLWMPGACDPARCPTAQEEPREAAPLCFGYFGALASHAGVSDLVNVFLQSSIRATLRICGYGKLSEGFERLAQVHERFRFDGLLPKPDDCLPFGQTCDVLVNPRPPGFGNQNNFPSKLFDYALCGRAILSSRISGVHQVLGPEAFYYDVTRHPESLKEALDQIAQIDRRELHRRGAAIRQRVIAEFNWPNQAARMAGFIRQLTGNGV
jgi:glycosyltransferase involved in cell wall biosynthesis